MKIERVAAHFEPIVITLESQDDVNNMFNLAIFAGEHEEAETSGVYPFASQVAAILQAHITTDEAEEEEFVEAEEIPEGN